MRPSISERMARWLPRMLRPRKDAPEEILIVRSGLSDSYYEFLAIFARVNRVALVLDRRSYERRHFDIGRARMERRLADRRGPPPAMWNAGDVIVLKSRTKDGPDAPSRHRQSRSS